MFGYTEKLNNIFNIVKEIRHEQVARMDAVDAIEEKDDEKDIWWKLEKIEDHLDGIHDDITKIDMVKAEKIHEDNQKMMNQLEYMMKEFKGLIEINVKMASKGKKRIKKS
jgi:hypothetical protein